MVCTRGRDGFYCMLSITITVPSFTIAITFKIFKSITIIMSPMGPMDSESDGTVASDTNINYTRVLLKSINTC